MKRQKWMSLINDAISRYFADIILLIFSILYGAQIFKFQEILVPYEVYKLASSSYITNRVVGLLFIIFGVIKLLGLLLDNYILEKISLAGLTFLWTLYLISFYFSLPPNTIWITAIVAVLTCYYLSTNER